MTGVRRSGRVLRAVLLVVAGAVGLVVIVVALQWRRDHASEDRALDAVQAYAAAVSADARTRAEPAPHDVQQYLFTQAVPERSVRQRYFTGDLAVAWTLSSPQDPTSFVTCVEMRSTDGTEFYAAAWAEAGEQTVTRTITGEGCGPPPASYDAARLPAGA